MPDKNRIRKAQDAYKDRSVEESRKAHSNKAISAAKEEHQKEKGKYLGDFVYGALDGIVTTFAVVSGVAGAKLSASIVLIMGFANLFGDGISMAFGNYLSSKSELEYINKERERESWEVDNVPEGEIDEIRHIYKKKGFEGEDLERAVKVITSNKEVWVETMMIEELGLKEEEKTPVASALATFVAFVVAGFVPLLVYVLGIFFPNLEPYAFGFSIGLTALTLFSVGAMRTYLTGVKWFRSGIEMLLVGGAAAAVAYLVGFALHSFGV